MSAIVQANECFLDELLLSLDGCRIESVFQPIVDLRHGVAVGFEVLSRGPQPCRDPERLFERARDIGATWELERACRLAALDAIDGLPDELRLRHSFFVNVSPDVLDDPRFAGGFTRSLARSRGIPLANIVIEITERASIRDHAAFEETVRHYTTQGFHIALDDFGAGNSGLVTLISCAPHYLKLDMAVTRRVDREPYKQRIVRSMIELARNIGAVLIAEGVETWAEAEALMRCGVEWAQGFVFGRPRPQARPIERAVSREIVRLWTIAHPQPIASDSRTSSFLE